MYYIAICDKNETFITYMVRIIQEVVKLEEYQFKIYKYTSAEELIYELEESIHFDLLFIDDHLKDMDGYEAARMFRSKFEDSVIVFCSSSMPNDQTFKVTPFRFLLKSYTDEVFIEEVDEILREMVRKAKDNYILGHYKRKLLKVSTRDVLYIENAKRGSRIVVIPTSKMAKVKHPIYLSEKLSEIEEKYDEFCFAHSSYIVNVNHVDSVKGGGILLDNGEYLSVSRTYYKTFREQFARSVVDNW